MTSAYSTVSIVPANADWPAHFEELRGRLEVIFPRPAFAVEHIGSTAIHGMDAKPVIDILLGAPQLSHIEAEIDRLAAIGFHYVEEYNLLIPERRYFTTPKIHPRRAHLHTVARGGKLWIDHLLFRDVLRQNPALADEYRMLKRVLAGRFANDAAAYTDAKAPFIRSVMNHARMKLELATP